MKLKVKDLDIATGYPLIAVLSKQDAKKYDLHYLDRIKVKKGKRIATVVMNIAESKKAVSPGKIGLYEEVLKKLDLQQNDVVTIEAAKKPLSLQTIRKKLDGKALSRQEIRQLVWDIVNNKLSSIELAYFVAASYMRAMSIQETIWFTKEITEHGEILKFDHKPIIDKHCIGGVPGNRTTMLLVPIVAAAGLTIPKTSSRSITSPAGTADTMEVLASVSFTLAEMKKIVEKTHGCIVWGGSLNLAPADDDTLNPSVSPLLVGASIVIPCVAHNKKLKSSRSIGSSVNCLIDLLLFIASTTVVSILEKSLGSSKVGTPSCVLYTPGHSLGGI